MLLLILKIYLGYFVFRQLVLYISSLVALLKVKDKLTRKLWFAASLGMTKRMDKLIAKGADINYQIKIENKVHKGMTALSWLILRHHHTFLIKRGFEYLLKKGADPYVVNIATEYKELPISVIQGTAIIQRSFFLQKILELTKPSYEKITQHNPMGGECLICEAADNNMPDNFKLLLDYIKNNFTKEQTKTTFKDLLPWSATVGWNYVYYWLKSGLDYSVKYQEEDNKPFLFKILEDNGIPPASVMDFNGGVDWIDKIWRLLESRGEKINIKINEDLSYYQKYITKDGERVLMVRPKKRRSDELKSERWRPYKHTFHYWWETKFASNRTRMILTRMLITGKRI